MYTNYNYSQQNLIRVTGIDGARAYQMPPNSTVALFDNANDYFYVKTTDGAGFPTIRTFKFEELQPQQATVNNYVTREELENYVKQFIQQPATATTKPVTTSND